MESFQGFYRKSIAVVASGLLLFSFAGTANAGLSGIQPGHPNFSSVDQFVYSKPSKKTGNISFNSDSAYWLTGPSEFLEVVFHADFDVNVDIKDLRDPVVDNGSITITGALASLGMGATEAASLANVDVLFTADIVSIGWTSGLVEFVMSGASQAGAVCDAGYCSGADEVLQFTFDGNDQFNGKWNKNFSKAAYAVATVPVPAAVWLFGSAIVGLVGLGRRKQTV